MRKTKILLGVVSVSLFVIFLAGQDPVKIASKHCKVEFENEYVRVLRWKIAPGEKTPMHEHPASIVVLLTGDRAKFTLPDGTTTETDGKAGQVTWNEGGKHSSQNMGDKATEVIQIELKAAAKPAGR